MTELLYTFSFLLLIARNCSQQGFNPDPFVPPFFSMIFSEEYPLQHHCTFQIDFLTRLYVADITPFVLVIPAKVSGEITPLCQEHGSRLAIAATGRTVWLCMPVAFFNSGRILRQIRTSCPVHLVAIAGVNKSPPLPMPPNNLITTIILENAAKPILLHPPCQQYSCHI